LDFWGSRQAYERFLKAHVAEYKALDQEGEKLTLRERRIGRYEMVVSQ
jgi:hypothetical protein